MRADRYKKSSQRYTLVHHRDLFEQSITFLSSAVK